MADVNFYLRDPKSQRATGVMLFLSFNGKRTKIATVDKITPKFWDEGDQRARQTKKFPTNAEFNQRLENLETTTLDVYRRYLNDNNQEQPQPETIKKLIKAELTDKTEPEVIPVVGLVAFAEQIAEEIKTGKRVSTKTGNSLSPSFYKTFKTHAAVLKDYQASKGKTLKFEDITTDFYQDFLEFLTKTRNYSKNTIGKHIKNLKAVLTFATDKGLNSMTKYKTFAPPSADVDNIYLDQQELKTLLELDLKHNFRLDRVRDLFLVGCWTGLRFSDFSNIRPNNFKNGFIEIRTQKTGKMVVIPILPPVAAIMSKYKDITENSLPPAMSNQKMNEYLKELGELAGITEIIQKEQTKGGKKVIFSQPKYSLISTHTARRSFATNAYKMKMPALSIMAITGHRTESNFMKYIKITPTEHAENMREIMQREFLKIVS